MNKYSKKLTDIALNIFGAIVDSVYCYVDVEDEESVKESEQKIEENNDNYKIICNGLTIYIKFKNGKIVEFTNSEWASITKINTLQT